MPSFAFELIAKQAIFVPTTSIASPTFSGIDFFAAALAPAT